jgi:hypothetical protein
VTSSSNERAASAARRARDLIVYADGVEEAGLENYARRARDVAREVIWLVEEVARERAARALIQERCDELRRLLAKRRKEAA